MAAVFVSVLPSATVPGTVAETIPAMTTGPARSAEISTPCSDRAAPARSSAAERCVIPRSLVRVLVVDAATGDPIAGARLTLHRCAGDAIPGDSAEPKP